MQTLLLFQEQFSVYFVFFTVCQDVGAVQIVFCPRDKRDALIYFVLSKRKLNTRKLRQKLAKLICRCAYLCAESFDQLTSRLAFLIVSDLRAVEDRASRAVRHAVQHSYRISERMGESRSRHGDCDACRR